MSSTLPKVDTVILAGGLGTRLRPLISDRPKILAPIGDKTLIDCVLDHLFKHGLRSIILSVGHMKEKIREHIEKQNLPGNAQVLFSEEENPLGTGGAIKKALTLASSEVVLVLNGDTFFPIDYSRFIESHTQAGSDISIGLRKIDDVSQSGTVLINDNYKITGFSEKTGESKRGIINGGVYLFKKNIFDDLSLPETFSIEKDFFEKHVSKIKAHGLVFPDYFIDIGTPENYKKAQDHFKAKNLTS